MTHLTLGIDISKDWLDAHLAPTGETRKFPNGKAGFRSLLAWLDGRALEKVVYEPTGYWHRDLEQALSDAGLPLTPVNPLQARRFAQARGRRAKTDAIDAGMLAQMGVAFELRKAILPSPQQRQLRELQQARWSRVQERIAVESRLPQFHDPLLKRQTRNRLRQVERERAALEAAIAELIQADAELARINRILISIPGISATTSATLLAELPEIGTLESQKVASLAGVAPMTRESGTWKGKSFIQGGRARLRCGLYMAALAAIRHNPDLRAKYQQLREAGKPGKVALTAIMRKLIILANTLVNQDRTWSANHPCRAIADAQ